jgi:3-isopropylmalate/(R)-2-methylmalate dehydratase small subunit
MGPTNVEENYLEKPSLREKNRMTPLNQHTGIVATLDRSNVDTDAIIPKQFLKSIQRTGYGPNAFFDWRYRPDGTLDEGFELNQPRFEGRSILVTRNNFGCGSSREHAVWALYQDGFRIIIAPWKAARDKRLPAFADIFRTNALKNGLLTIELSEREVDLIFDWVAKYPGLEATVDLPAQTITLHAPEQHVFAFRIDPGAKEKLLQGLDDIAQTLAYTDAINRFEATHEDWFKASGS